MFVNSKEYKGLKNNEKVGINNEIAYMCMTLDIMTKLFSLKGGTERSVVAWEKQSKGPCQRVYRFSCIKVASLALDCNKSKISAVCRGKRGSCNGYVFQYEEDYDQDENLIVSEQEYKT